MATAYCHECKTYGHYTGCKTAAQAQMRREAQMKASTTEQYAADAQLQRDIEAARGVKPADPQCHDPVNQPIHYRSHPSGIEAIQITEHMSFCLGNAIKYIWRADLKGDAIEDLKKSIWYIEREIKRREK